MIDSSNVSFLPGCEPGEAVANALYQAFEPSERAIKKADQLIQA